MHLFHHRNMADNIATAARQLLPDDVADDAPALTVTTEPDGATVTADFPATTIRLAIRDNPTGGFVYTVHTTAKADGLDRFAVRTYTPMQALDDLVDQVAGTVRHNRTPANA